jgi:Ca2+-binding RTX toxin-like protein
VPDFDLPTLKNGFSGFGGFGGFVINGEAASDTSGSSVSSAGDVNGDGFDDLIVGAPGTDTQGGTDSGASYVIFGHRALEAVTRIGTDIGQTINGGVANDFIDARGGNDVLKGWEGVDQLHGGTGNDTFVLDDVHASTFGLPEEYDPVVEAANAGNDTARIASIDLTGPINEYALTANVEHGILTGAVDFDLIGNELNNRLAGNLAGNVLFGQGGNDRLAAGQGVDLLRGGLGNDTYVLNDLHGASSPLAFDSVIEAAEQGTDTVRVQSLDTNPAGADSYALTDNVENGVITGTRDFTLAGNTLTNRLTGNAASNSLNGGGGDDFLLGGRGQDRMAGGTGGDQFDFNAVIESGPANSSRDVITGFTHLADDIDLSTIDAKAGTGGNNAFSFIGAAGFSAEGQVRAVQSGAHTLVQVNTTGASGGEMSVLLVDVTASTITAADFIV